VLKHLPDDGARRVLASIGTRHVVIHAGDLPRPQVPEELARKPAFFRRVFHEGGDSVFTLVPQNDPTLALLEMPKLPAGARAVPHSELRASADLGAREARRAVDGDLRSYWSTRRHQARGQSFELQWARERPVVALELDSQGHVSHVPASFELSVARAGSPWQRVAGQSVVRIYREQIYSPKNFVFRVVLPEPVRADRLRIGIDQPLPGHEFIVHEARLYVASP
jgi:hypothetical protein